MLSPEKLNYLVQYYYNMSLKFNIAGLLMSFCPRWQLFADVSNTRFVVFYASVQVVCALVLDESIISRCEIV